MNRLNVTGSLARQKPKKGKVSKDRFGAIYGGHYSLSDHRGPVKLNYVGHSFEQIFREVDMEILDPLNELRRWSNCINPTAIAIEPCYAMKTPELLKWTIHDYLKVLKWTLSVHFRSPSFRRKYSINAASEGWDDRQKEAVGAANVEYFFSQLEDIEWPPESNFKFSCIRSIGSEFLFGDYIDQDLVEGDLKFIRKNSSWALWLDGFIEIALFPDLILRIEADPFGKSRVELQLYDVSLENIIAKNKRIFTLSEEVFFRNKKVFENLGNLQFQKGVSGKRHYGKSLM